MIDKLKTQFFFFKYSLIKPAARSYFKEVIKNQFLAVEELEHLNWERTKALLGYAYDNVPYYSETFKRIGLNPKDITKPEYYEQVPVLTRQLLRDNFSKLISKEARPSDLRISTTGGSTGKPAKVYHQKNVVRAAMGWRMHKWWGLSPDVNVASVYRDVNKGWKSRLINKLYWWPTKKILLDASSIDEKDIKKFIDKYRTVKPELIHAYVGALDYLATYVLEKKITLPIPKAIWTTSSPLTETQERRIEKAFGAPVYDQYGCCEVYWLAAQCPQKEGLHIFHDVRKIEFLNADDIPVPKGKLGRIAVTDLENKYFPIIRYINGDEGMALPKQCSCGINLPLMDKVKGRISDTIRLPDGTAIGSVTTIFDEAPDAVNQFQVCQRKDFSIDIIVVPNKDYLNYKKVLDDVKSNLSKQLKGVVTVRIKQVPQIEQKGGKLRFVVSEINSE